MQFINYFFASIISFSGIFIGITLVKIAPEEQKPLKKYFLSARKILLLLIFLFLSLYYFNKAVYVAAIILTLAFLIFIECKAADLFKKSLFNYSVFGILFFLASENTNLFAIESSLILLYGLPTASLLYNKKEKNYNLLLHNAVFVLIACLLFYTSTIFHS